MHRIGRARAVLRVAPQPDHPHVECLGELREASANVAEPDDQQGLAAEFVLARRQVADHAAPDALPLIVAGLGQPPRQRQDQRDGVFRDRLRVDAARAGEADAALLEGLAPELIGAGPDRLDEAQLGGARGEIVAPQPRDHQHIGIGDAPAKLLGAANLKARDTGIAPRELRLKLIGDMREADRQLVPGWQHALVLPLVPPAGKTA